MRVLWISNILFPEAEELLTGSGELKASGGWMTGAAEALVRDDDIQLCVACVSDKVKSLTRISGRRILYYVLPKGKGNIKVNNDYCPYWLQIKSEFKPDITHIHGTEFSHGLAYLKACGNDNVVISIQGLTSVCSKYYCYGMTRADVYRNLTFKDILKGTVFHGQKLFAKRGKYELEMLGMAKHIIGRTSWDHAHVWAVNPDAEYHFCNETLRPEFYGGATWSYGRCDKHSIFIGKATYPLKGLHQVLKAMPLILRHYPDTKIRIAGFDIVRTTTLIDKLRLSGYGRYLRRLIKMNRLEDIITFTGPLNGEQMKNEYLRANVFVCPSSIENSPNSLGEAQILGTPCVAGYVGGTMDMMLGNEDNLYRFEEVEMLAEKICSIFANQDRQPDMRATAALRHDPETNRKTLLEIYRKIRRTDSSDR